MAEFGFGLFSFGRHSLLLGGYGLFRVEKVRSISILFSVADIDLADMICDRCSIDQF